MKKNIYDVALGGINEVIEEVSDGIATEFKGTNPFDKEPMSNDETNYIYQNMSQEDLQYIIQAYGRDAVNKRFYEIEGRRK